MTKGKPWTVDEEATLKALANANTPIDQYRIKKVVVPSAFSSNWGWRAPKVD
jgi:hypothetical protein